MTPPALPQAALRELLGDARLRVQSPPGLAERLWLIDARGMDRAFSAGEAARILENPPYWCFCWASGLALARRFAEEPARVRGKRVLDVGSGSGIVAIAAARAGAASVVACDLDPVALAACEANARLNGVDLRLATDYRALAADFDLITAADLLYDPANLPLLEDLPRHGREVLVADSRVRHFAHPAYRRLAQVEACTWPDLDEPLEFRRVSLYGSAP